MQLVTINDSLAPIRLLRQTDALDDAYLDGFLSRELAFKRRALAERRRWLDVLDCRTLTTMTDRQRLLVRGWLNANLAQLADASLGFAVVLPPHLEADGHRLASLLNRAGIPTHVCTELESALYWALDAALDSGDDDDDLDIAPALVLNGIDALRLTLA